MGETDTIMPKNTVDVPVERYHEILEANLEQSIELNRLRKALQNECAYSSKLLEEIYKLNTEHRKEMDALRAEMKLMMDFLNNNHLAGDYNQFANQTAVEE